MPSTPHEIYIITYESGSVDDAREQAERGAAVVCTDFFVERELTKKNIPFVSLRDIIDTTTGGETWWELSHQIAREWYRLPAMKFFEYDGIRIAEAPEPAMGIYLARLFYYVRIYNALKKKYPNAHFTIPAPPATKDVSNLYFLAVFISRAVIDAARMVGLHFDVNDILVSLQMYPFPRPSWKSFLIRAYNFIVGFAPRRSFKIYASEYWTHIAPVIGQIDDGEVMLVESRDFYKIPLRQILKHRIRIRYPDGKIGDSEQRAVIRITEEFPNQWEAAKGDISAYLSGVDGTLDWGPVLQACESFITYAPRVVSDIRTFRRIMEKERPDIVLQMASIGGPRHYFFLMARVAAKLKIPSLELQHAGATIDPRSMFCRIETDYRATYGVDVNAWHERVGYNPEKLIAVGSPRFDKYVTERAQGVEKGKQLFVRLGLDPARSVLLVVVPVAENYVSLSDSYQLAELFETIRAVQNATPDLQVLFKFHNDKSFGTALEYLRELFPADIAIAGSEDIFPLLCASDAVVCNNSTVIYEALLAGKPLILCPWWTHDTYHAQVYERAAPLFYSAKEAMDSILRMCADPLYREELLVRRRHFLEEYSFDGKSSQRVAALLHNLPRRYRR